MDEAREEEGVRQKKWHMPRPDMKAAWMVRAHRLEGKGRGQARW